MERSYHFCLAYFEEGMIFPHTYDGILTTTANPFDINFYKIIKNEISKGMIPKRDPDKCVLTSFNLLAERFL